MKLRWLVEEKKLWEKSYSDAIIINQELSIKHRMIMDINDHYKDDHSKRGMYGKNENATFDYKRV